MDPDLVVGGGVAGLVVARRLALAGRRVVVLEASTRLGGQLARHELAGVGLDAAAESFATRGGVVAALLGELGLSGEVVLPDPAPAWLHRADGTAVPLPATGVLGIPGRPLARDVRRAIGARAALRARLDAVLPAALGAGAATLGELVRLRMGRGVLDGLVAPVVRGVHSRDPGDLAIEAAAPALRAELAARGSLAAAVRGLRAAAPAGSQVAGLRGGMSRLVDALAAEGARHGVEIETGARVEELAPDGVRVAGRRLAGRVILAAPDPAAPPPARRVILVTLVAEAPAWAAAPRGTGLLVAAGAPGVSARALTHASAKWAWIREALPGLETVRLSYDDEAEDAIGRATGDAAVLLGSPAAHVVAADVVSWERPAAVAPPRADGIPATGETASGTGLAAVVSHAERLARELAEVP